jgi:hypothetical protein
VILNVSNDLFISAQSIIISEFQLYDICNVISCVTTMILHPYEVGAQGDHFLATISGLLLFPI